MGSAAGAIASTPLALTAVAPQTGFPQTTTFHDRHQVDHMTADAAAPCRDTRC
jgi:hypothetical protein